VKKLIRGIIEFRKNVLDEYRETFAKLALGQSPDTLFIACSDSRVVPNLFASTNPGDLFVVRNIGNIIPPFIGTHHENFDESIAAAIEFAVLILKVSYIIVCGHSECGAMQALMRSKPNNETPHLEHWLQHAKTALNPLQDYPPSSSKIAPHNHLSQINILQQIAHLKTYPSVKQRLEDKTLSIYGWWFDIAHADVYAYENDLKKFVLIDEELAKKVY